jgi:sec-independent protein translocase protein TatA
MPSGSEWIIVLVIVLLVFGGSQLPKLAKNLGKAQKEFKDGLAEGAEEAGDEASTDKS